MALDVDGTLIGQDLQIHPRTREAIAAARSQGVQFVIVTGRMYQSTTAFARELGLEGMPVVAYNGALVQEFPSGRTIYHEPVPLATCKALAAFCENRGYHLQAYVNDELFVPDMGPRTRQYVEIAKVKAKPVGSLFLWFTEPSSKLLIIDDPARMPGLQREVQELLGSSVEVAPSYPIFLEIVNRHVSKGKALAAVAESMGFTRDQVMAVGDGMNDLPMITWAGTSFAMAHAPEALKRVATHVTEQGASLGVAEALDRMGLTAVAGGI